MQLVVNTAQAYFLLTHCLRGVVTELGSVSAGALHSSIECRLSHTLCSGSTVYNVCTEEEDGESGAATRQSLENSITMNKMRQLKAKMEDMNLNKKVGAN